MKKKEILKEQEKLKKERNQVFLDFNDKNEVKNTIKIIIGVVLFIGIAFLIMSAINGDLNIFSRKNTIYGDYGENRVMCGTLLNQSTSKYLVLAYDFSVLEQKNLYGSIKSSYSNLTVFEMDLHSAFNKSCVGEKLNISSDISKLKLSGPTLLIIDNNQITESYKTEEEIINYFSK